VAQPAPPESCCGFGYRLYHRKDSCAYIDLVILSLEVKPFTDVFAPLPEGKKVWVIPEDRGVDRPGAMMLQRGQWKNTDSGEWDWMGNASSQFPKQYTLEDELFPLQQMQMYKLTVNIPKEPRAILERTYGTTCFDSDDKGRNFNLNPELLEPAHVNIM